ncbi:hypothetical protein T492DRAFT_974019 [Pavlovales sp. CCMP2436]|nr:hypothetical protein T492DRAFT_974019 [Pavlovales sp. CCMP2436]
MATARVALASAVAVGSLVLAYRTFWGAAASARVGGEKTLLLATTSQSPTPDPEGVAAVVDRGVRRDGGSTTVRVALAAAIVACSLLLVCQTFWNEASEADPEPDPDPEKWERADARYFEQILNKPGDASLFAKRSMVQLKLGRPDRAFTLATCALITRPRWSRVWARYAQAADAEWPALACEAWMTAISLETDAEARAGFVDSLASLHGQAPHPPPSLSEAVALFRQVEGSAAGMREARRWQRPNASEEELDSFYGAMLFHAQAQMRAAITTHALAALPRSTEAWSMAYVPLNAFEPLTGLPLFSLSVRVERPAPPSQPLEAEPYAQMEVGAAVLHFTPDAAAALGAVETAMGCPKGGCGAPRRPLRLVLQHGFGEAAAAHVRQALQPLQVETHLETEAAALARLSRPPAPPPRQAADPAPRQRGSSRAVPRKCASCALYESESRRKFRKCGGCGELWYCGQSCARDDWQAGHREACSRARCGEVGPEE